MKTSITIALLFGVALVPALPTSKSVKSTSEFKDWAVGKKSLTKLGNDSIDSIKQGNRTKKSIICVQAPESEGCPPGCGGEQGSPPSQGPPMSIAASFGESDFPRPPAATLSYSYPPIQQVMLPQLDSQYGVESEESFMRPSAPQIQVQYRPAPSAPVIRPSAPQTQFVYRPASQASPMSPQAPQTQFVYRPAPQTSPMIPQAPQQQVVQQPTPPALVMRPSSPQSQIVYRPAPQASPMIQQAPQQQVVQQSAPPAIVMRPSSPQSQSVYRPAPQASPMIPQAPQQQVMHQSAPPAIVMRPSSPQSQIVYRPAPQASPMILQAPQQQVMHQSAPPAIVMRPSSPQSQIVYRPAPQASPMMPQAPQQQVMYQSPPPNRIMMSPLPDFPPPIQPPPIQLSLPRPPKLAGPISQIPPCPPEEKYLIPPQDSREMIFHEMVPVVHHIPSSPGRVITTERPPYPCLPPGAHQPIPPQQSAASLTTVQQQSTVNQLQVVQAQAYSAASGNYEYSQPQPSMSSFNDYQNHQPSGDMQSPQASGNVHMIQLPSINPSYSQEYPTAGASPMFNEGYASPSQQHQFIEPSAFGPSAGYEEVGHQQPMMIFGGPTVDCADVHPVQSGAYGYQSSQSVAQSYAAQSAAYSSFGEASFRSAEDANGASNSTTPQLYQTENYHNHGYSAPSSRSSPHGYRNIYSKRDVTKKGTEKKVKA